MSRHRTVVLNGQHSESGLIQLDADDEGLLLGRSIFETLRTYQRKVFALDEHLERLAASAAAMQIPTPDCDALAEEIVWAAATMPQDSVVRVTWTAGGMRIVRATEIPVVPSPFRCVTRRFIPPFWLDGTVKHTSRAYSRIAVLDAGVEEVLWVDEAGSLLEGTRSNVFAVKEGVFCTPPADGRLLSGVTRSFLLDAADSIGVPVALDAIDTWFDCDELYVSSTIKELTGIDSVDGQRAPGSGPVGTRIMEAFRDLAAQHLT